MDELVLCVPADVLASCSACLLRESATACRRPLRGQNLAWFLVRVRPELLCLHAAQERHRLPPAAAWTEPGLALGSRAARAAVCSPRLASWALARPCRARVPGTAGHKGANEGAGGSSPCSPTDGERNTRGGKGKGSEEDVTMTS